MGAGVKHAWLYLILLAVVAIGIGFLVFSREAEGEFHWSAITAFSAAFGIVGSIVLVFVAKFLGRYWLHRDEDYYD